MNLRPYQTELVTKIRTELKNGSKSVVGVCGCGSAVFLGSDAVDEAGGAICEHH